MRMTRYENMIDEGGLGGKQQFGIETRGDIGSEVARYSSTCRKEQRDIRYKGSDKSDHRPAIRYFQTSSLDQPHIQNPPNLATKKKLPTSNTPTLRKNPTTPRANKHTYLHPILRRHNSRQQTLIRLRRLPVDRHPVEPCYLVLYRSRI